MRPTRASGSTHRPLFGLAPRGSTVSFHPGNLRVAPSPCTPVRISFLFRSQWSPTAPLGAAPLPGERSFLRAAPRGPPTDSYPGSCMNPTHIKILRKRTAKTPLRSPRGKQQRPHTAGTPWMTGLRRDGASSENLQEHSPRELNYRGANQMPPSASSYINAR